MKSLDPRVKLLFVLETTSLALVFIRLPWLAGLLALSLLLSLLLGARLAAFFRRLRALIWLLAMVALMQCVFVRSGPPWLSWGDTVLIYRDGAAAAAQVAGRYLVILAGAALMAAEDSRRVIASLSKLGLPYTFVFMLMTALRFLPLFSQAFSDAMMAVQLRGVELRRIPVGKRLWLYGSLLMPVTAEAVLRSQQLAVAMEARGFGAYTTRTSYYQISMGSRDWLALGVLLLLGGAALALYLLAPL